MGTFEKPQRRKKGLQFQEYSFLCKKIYIFSMNQALAICFPPASDIVLSPANGLKGKRGLSSNGKTDLWATYF